MGVKILVFGDSIGWGAFDAEKGGWVERLKTHYFDYYKNSGIAVYNFSVSSNTSVGVLNQIDNVIKHLEVAEKDDNYVFLISIGTNDSMYIESKDNFFVSIDLFKKNIIKIIEKSRKYSKQIIFTGFTKVDESKSMPWKDYLKENFYWENLEMNKYQIELRKICEENKIQFIELWDLLDDKDLPDGLHPNARGHEKIYMRVRRELENTLK